MKLLLILALILPVQLPDLPPLPPPCIPVPLPPPVPPCVTPQPVPGDNPPTISPLAKRLRTKQNIVVTWRARDDRGIWGYRYYVDRRYVARSKPKSQVRFHLRCGSHLYRVEVVDTVNQGDMAAVRVFRRCR